MTKTLPDTSAALDQPSVQLSAPDCQAPAEKTKSEKKPISHATADIQKDRTEELKALFDHTLKRTIGIHLYPNQVTVRHQMEKVCTLLRRGLAARGCTFCWKEKVVMSESCFRREANTVTLSAGSLRAQYLSLLRAYMTQAIPMSWLPHDSSGVRFLFLQYSLPLLAASVFAQLVPEADEYVPSLVRSCLLQEISDFHKAGFSEDLEYTEFADHAVRGLLAGVTMALYEAELPVPADLSERCRKAFAEWQMVIQNNPLGNQNAKTVYADAIEKLTVCVSRNDLKLSLGVSLPGLLGRYLHATHTIELSEKIDGELQQAETLAHEMVHWIQHASSSEVIPVPVAGSALHLQAETEAILIAHCFLEALHLQLTGQPSGTVPHISYLYDVIDSYSVLHHENPFHADFVSHICQTAIRFFEAVAGRSATSQVSSATNTPAENSLS